MSTNITASRSKYVVKDSRLDEAIGFLGPFAEYKGAIHSASWGQDTSIVYPFVGGLFCGDVPYAWCENVEEFIMDFCEPDSYATFLCEESFTYVMVWKDEDGKVNIEEREIANPFESECDRMESEQKELSL